MARKTYSKQFREQACRLVKEEGYTAAQAAKSLGIHPNTVLYWLRTRGPAGEPLENQGEPTARGEVTKADPKAMAIQIRELEAKVRRLEMEKEILKKATAYFATLHP
jgi:transposase